MPHRLKEAKNVPSAKQLENIMIAFIKLSLILTGTACSTRKHCLPPYKDMVNPVEKHASTNELISDMNCAVYARVFRWSAHSFPSLLWAKFRRESDYCTQTNLAEFLTETAL